MPPKTYQPADNRGSSQTWLTTVLAFLAEDGWPHETVEDGSAILTRYQGERGIYDLTLEVDDEVGLLVVHAQLPFELGDGEAEDRLSQVAELVLRINCGLAVGSLDLDLDEASVRFRVGMMLGTTPPSADLVRNALYTAVHAADQFSPLVQAVGDGELQVEAALEALASGN